METNDIQSSSCITLWRQVTPDMLAVAELRQICAMRGSGKKSRGGSLRVTFSHHYAVLFRVPTWGLVFLLWPKWHPKLEPWKNYPHAKMAQQLEVHSLGMVGAQASMCSKGPDISISL